jgi:DNA invertase Pin-like site-specific DNA recombinase
MANKITALYCRLSAEDRGFETGGKSNSIINQKNILVKYAKDNGFTNTRFFIDDGISGTLFNRPGLNAMLEEVNNDNVAVVIIKDQSRIGRDVLEVGLLKRQFEEHNVRFIAAADGLDSAKGFDIMSIFRDGFYEFYVADCSRKVRAAKRAGALQGRVLGKVPYGYIGSEDKTAWLVDEEAAAIVQEVFEKYTAGTGIVEICRDLTLRGVPRPEDRRKGEPMSAPWDVSYACRMIENPTYIGRYEMQKRTNVSYKNHTRVKRPPDEWVVIENHHPALVDIEIFEIAQRLRSGRRKRTKLGEKSILSGLVFCNDCNSSLSYCREGSQFPKFICSRYRNSNAMNEHKCTRHGIRVDNLEQIALLKIQETAALALDDEKTFTESVHKLSNSDSEKAIRLKTAEHKKAESRSVELNKIIKKIYEDRVSGVLGDDRFTKMLSEYETEQSQLAVMIKTLQAEIEEFKSKITDLQSFMNLVNRYGRISELSEETERAFIERIVVHEAVIKEGKKRVKESQQVDIHLAYIGMFYIE